MAAGDIKIYGTATIPAGAPGSAGSVDVASAGVAATDRVVATISDIAAQNLSDRKRDDLTFQVIKKAGVGLTFVCNNKQNKAFKVDYVTIQGA